MGCSAVASSMLFETSQPASFSLKDEASLLSDHCFRGCDATRGELQTPTPTAPSAPRRGVRGGGISEFKSRARALRNARNGVEFKIF